MRQNRPVEPNVIPSGKMLNAEDEMSQNGSYSLAKYTFLKESKSSVSNLRADIQKLKQQHLAANMNR